MSEFTAGGGKKASVKKADGNLPSKKAMSVTRGGGTQPRLRNKSDGSGMEDGHMDEAMSDGAGGGPAKGPSFHGKFDASAMSQVLRKKGGGGGLY